MRQHKIWCVCVRACVLCGEVCWTAVQHTYTHNNNNNNNNNNNIENNSNVYYLKFKMSALKTGVSYGKGV